MKTINEQIIEKQDEIIINLKEVGKLYFLCKDHATKKDVEKMKALYKEAERLESELSALKQQAEKTPAKELSNNRQQSEDSANNLKTAGQEKVTDVKKEIDRLLNVAYQEGMNNTKSKEFDNWTKYAINRIISMFEQEKVTDEDIEKFMCGVIFTEFDSYWDAMKYGAKAMRDGLITHNK